MEKLLVTGGSGLLGSNIAKIAKLNFDVYSYYYKNKVEIKNIHFSQIDLTKKESQKEIEKIKPDFIINCAAQTDVDFCESNPEEAYKLNVDSSINIAEASNKIGAYLIHVSTDAVFNGEIGNYNEKDTPNPINEYGKTKLASEKAVNSICPNSCIVRTNIYGWNIRSKFSLAEWMIDKLQKKEVINGFSDVYFSPIFVNDLTSVLFDLKKINYHGTIHIGSSDCVSKLNFAYLIAEVFKLDGGIIKPSNIDDGKFNARRPKKTCLNTQKAIDLNLNINTVKAGLLHMKQTLNNGYVNELKHG